MPDSQDTFTAYWALDAETLASRLASSTEGLSENEARARLDRVGPNRLTPRDRVSGWRATFDQLKNPLLLILLVAAAASGLAGEWVNAIIVVTIVVASVGIAAFREHRAQIAVEALQAKVRTHAQVLRSGTIRAVPVEEVVPGDVVVLAAGSLVPADGILLEATDCFVSEAVLTGESFPVEKRPGVVVPTAALRDRTNCVFFGTNIRSGIARFLVAHTGSGTEFARWQLGWRYGARRPSSREACGDSAHSCRAPRSCSCSWSRPSTC